MKKRLTMFLLLFFILATNVVAGESTKYDQYAEKLAELKVFNGTGSGFDLDREPTRLEGLIMLIRLLGVEEEALKMKDEPCVFEDVPDWGKGYVNYAYANKLTNGVSETKFGSNDRILAKSYMTFLLRALGYDDKAGDFQWSTALEYSKEVGLIDENFYFSIVDSKFLRDHVAKSSYDALLTSVKGNDSNLIKKLVSKGVISEVAANSITNLNKTDIKQEMNTEEIAELADGVVMINTSTGSGSGFIISSDGVIVTNYHVIEYSNSVEIVFNDETIYNGKVYIKDYDEDLDIAILKIDKKNLKPVKLGDSSKVKVGQKIVAIGSPIGLFNTVSEGIISSIRNNDIQITAPISPGSSGGAVFNTYGEVIGITYAGITDGENLGFVIPINQLSTLEDNKMILVEEHVNQSSLVIPPKNISLVTLEPTYAYFTWDEVKGADYYHFYYQTDGEEGFWYDVEEDGITPLKFYYDDYYIVELFNLQPDTFYNIIVTSVKNGVESRDSDVFTFSTPELIGDFTLYAEDGTYLGKITNDIHDPDSISNERGTYGSSSSQFSIFNMNGLYGRYNSDYSPFNNLATKPPYIYIGDTYIGRLTNNPDIPDGIRLEDIFHTFINP